jgi:hypothetical protein
MSKTNITISVDTDIAETIRVMNINKSDLINDFLRSYINSPKENKGVEKIEIQKKLEEVEQAKVEAITQEAELKQKLNVIEVQELQVKQETIKREEEFKEKQKLCLVCGQYFQHGNYARFLIEGQERYIHNSCYLNVDIYHKYSKMELKK